MKNKINHLIALITRQITGFPIWSSLEIDIQSACNRDCIFCPRHLDRSGIRKDANGNPTYQRMPTEQVYRIIDQAVALGFRGRTKLHRLSEGLLDARYLEFARYIKARGLHLKDDTNGDVLRKNPDLCQKLDGLVDQLTIGLYDYTNEMEKQKEILFWKSKFQKTELVFSLPNEYCIIRQGSKIYAEVTKKAEVLELPCKQPFQFLLIRYDGQVSLCCEDDLCQFNLGNAFTHSLLAIWWSAKHINIARTLQKAGGRHRFDRCSQCYFLQDRVSLLDRNKEFPLPDQPNIPRVLK
jgi:radical SAM protein with 4Fe4S-binding SPASM domain